MKVTLIAGLVASLAISVSAGAGGKGGTGGGFHFGGTGASGGGGKGGSSGPTNGGSAVSGPAGGGGPIGNTQSNMVGAGGSGGSNSINVGAPIGPQVFYGNVQGLSEFSPSANGAASNAGGVSNTASNAGATSSGGISKSSSGPTVGGTAGSGGSSGTTGNGVKGNQAGQGGGGGTGGSVPIQATIPIPAKRSLEEMNQVLHPRNAPHAQLTEKEIMDAIEHNEKLPGPVEAELPQSVIGHEFNIPSGRGPVKAAYASLDCSGAVQLLKQGKIPDDVKGVLTKYWGKKGSQPTNKASTAGQGKAHEAQHPATNSKGHPSAQHPAGKVVPGHKVPAHKRAVAFQG